MLWNHHMDGTWWWCEVWKVTVSEEVSAIWDEIWHMQWEGRGDADGVDPTCVGCVFFSSNVWGCVTGCHSLFLSYWCLVRNHICNQTVSDARDFCHGWTMDLGFLIHKWKASLWRKWQTIKNWSFYFCSSWSLREILWLDKKGEMIQKYAENYLRGD